MTTSRRTTLPASLARAECAVLNNDATTLKAVASALVGLYAALHGLRAAVTTDVRVSGETRTRRVHVSPTVSGPAYTAEGEHRIDAALTLIRDLTDALRVGRPFGRCMVDP